MTRFLAFLFLFSPLPAKADPPCAILGHCPAADANVGVANPAAGVTEVCSARYSDVRPKDAPLDSFLCPLRDGFHPLPATYPPAGVFINFVPPIPRAFPGNAPMIEQLAATVKTASPNTRINIVVNQDQLAKANTAFAALLRSNPLVRIIPVNAGVSLWAQDTHEFGVDWRGRPHILDLPTEPARGADTPRALANACSGGPGLQYVCEPAGSSRPMVNPTFEDGDPCVDGFFNVGGMATGAARNRAIEKYATDFPNCAAQMRAQPPHTVNFPDPPCCAKIRSYNSEDFGGNLEPMPGGVVAVGSGMGGGIKSYLRSQANDVLELETSFLSVGHVDELFSTIRNNNPAPCNFTLLAASPAEGLRILDERKGAHPNELVGHRDVEHPPRKVKQWLDDREFVTKNRLLNAVIEDDRNRLLARLREKTHCPSVQALNVPTLFSTGGWTREMGTMPVGNGSPGLSTAEMENPAAVVADPVKRRLLMSSLRSFRSESQLPNMVNGLALNNTMAVPDPRYAPFENQMRCLLAQPAGVAPASPCAMPSPAAPLPVAAPSFIRDTVYHEGIGEVHCGTNVIRTCNPLLEAF